MNINKISKLLLSISVFIFSVAALIFVLKFGPTKLYAAGSKFQLSTAAVYNPSDDDHYIFETIINTSTGKIMSRTQKKRY